MNDPVASDVGPEYCCPDGVSVSRAVHLARLAAGWSGCDQCASRNDSEGIPQSVVAGLDQIRDHRSDGIVRTEFGVRGPYLNRIDRRTAARLAQVFCCGFVRNDFADRNSDHPVQATLPTVLVGFDGRAAAPDVFVGVVSAIREFGLDLRDAGRSTAASLSEAIRAFPNCAGAFLVTGAGSPPAWIGLDVLDRHGDPAAVVWKDHGIGLHSDSMSSTLVISLPDDAQSRNGNRRVARRSGSHQTVDFEDRYIRWLRRWYPSSSTSAVSVCTADPLIAERIHRIAESVGFSVLVRNPADQTPLPPVSVSVRIEEDDRQFVVTDSMGRTLSASQLADRLNRRIRTESPHITAHADSASGRFWLTDTGRPTSSFATEQIRDALATLGLLLKLG